MWVSGLLPEQENKCTTPHVLYVCPLFVCLFVCLLKIEYFGDNHIYGELKMIKNTSFRKVNFIVMIT